MAVTRPITPDQDSQVSNVESLLAKLPLSPPDSPKVTVKKGYVGSTTASEVPVESEQKTELNKTVPVWVTEKQKSHLRELWGPLDQSAVEFITTTFYKNLLTEHPELKSMFSNLQRQAVALARTLTLVIDNLDNKELVDEKVTALAIRHGRIEGITQGHYDVVATTLLGAIKEIYGDGFTLDQQTSLATLYGYISHIMIEKGNVPA